MGVQLILWENRLKSAKTNFVEIVLRRSREIPLLPKIESCYCGGGRKHLMSKGINAVSIRTNQIQELAEAL